MEWRAVVKVNGFSAESPSIMSSFAFGMPFEKSKTVASWAKRGNASKRKVKVDIRRVICIRSTIGRTCDNGMYRFKSIGLLAGVLFVVIAVHSTQPNSRFTREASWNHSFRTPVNELVLGFRYVDYFSRCSLN